MLTAAISSQAQASSSSTGVGVFQKLARVFKEKAQQDLDRIIKGTSKTREKLGVRAAAAAAAAAEPVLIY